MEFHLDVGKSACMHHPNVSMSFISTASFQTSSRTVRTNSEGELHSTSWVILGNETQVKKELWAFAQVTKESSVINTPTPLPSPLYPAAPGIHPACSLKFSICYKIFILLFKCSLDTALPVFIRKAIRLKWLKPGYMTVEFHSPWVSTLM